MEWKTDILESSEPLNLESKPLPAKWYENANSDDNANTFSHFEMLEFGRFTREGYFNDRNDGKFIIVETLVMSIVPVVVTTTIYFA